MKYMCLIYGQEIEQSEAEINAEIGEYMAFGKVIQDAGVDAGMSEALLPTSTATSVRVRDGQTMTTDGPFAATKEALGGFYVLDCSDINEAIKYAAQIPGAKTGTVEIRPLMVIE